MHIVVYFHSCMPSMRSACACTHMYMCLSIAPVSLLSCATPLVHNRSITLRRIGLLASSSGQPFTKNKQIEVSKTHASQTSPTIILLLQTKKYKSEIHILQIKFQTKLKICSRPKLTKVTHKRGYLIIWPCSIITTQQRRNVQALHHVQ